MRPAVTQPESGRPDQWVDHPRIRIGPKGVLLGIAVLLLGILGAWASVRLRRTQLEQTTEYWGPEVIRAIQLAPQVELRLEPVGWTPAQGAERADPGPPLAADGDSGPPLAADGDPSAAEVATINLSGIPGLGYLRKALLDQRHYEWHSRRDVPLASLRDAQSQFAELTFTDTAGRLSTAVIQLELTEGWVGPADGSGPVRLTRRVRPAVRHFLTVISSAEQANYDRRMQAARQAESRGD